MCLLSSTLLVHFFTCCNPPWVELFLCKRRKMLLKSSKMPKGVEKRKLTCSSEIHPHDVSWCHVQNILYFKIQVTATFAVFCRTLAFNALTVFMWNCSADLWSWRLDSPSPHVCMWLTQLCVPCEQWKDTVCSLKSYMCLLFSLQHRLYGLMLRNDEL